MNGSLLQRAKTLLQQWQVNRAVAYLIIARVWQFLSGFVTIALLSKSLTDDEIGVYYAFASQVGVQMLVELGLPQIVTLLASHEWAHLEFDAVGRIQGNPRCQQRLAGLVRLADRWFLGIALLFVLVGGGLGTWNLQHSPVGTVDWHWPWCGAVLSSLACLPYAPRIALLEGCNQVDRVNHVRLLQSVAGTVAAWVCLSSGMGLWALTAGNLVRWGCETWLVAIQYRPAFQSLASTTVTEPIDWRREIWPLHWRQAAQGMSAYFGAYFFQPLMLRFQGATIAGRFGLSWQIINIVYSVSFSWLNTRYAELGVLASRGERAELDRRFAQLERVSVTILTIGFMALCGAVELLRAVRLAIGDRFLDSSEVLGLAVGLLGILLVSFWQVRIKVEKRDPFMIINTTTGLLYALMAWVTIPSGGVIGLGIGYAVIVWGYLIPLSLRRIRKVGLSAHVSSQITL